MIALVIGIQVLVVGVVLFALTPRIRRRWPTADGYVALIRTVTFVLGVGLIAFGATGKATPMTDTPNPNPFQVRSVEAGAELYEASCARCHGVDARGNGPDAASLAVEPPSLRAHLADHTDGDIYYWITNGRPGMPAFPELAEGGWDIVNYLWSLNGRVPASP